MVTIQKSVSVCWLSLGDAEIPLHKTATSHQDSTFLDEGYLMLHLMFKWSVVHQQEGLKNSSLVRLRIYFGLD